MKSTVHILKKSILTFSLFIMNSSYVYAHLPEMVPASQMKQQDFEKLTSLYYYGPNEVELDLMNKKLMSSLIEYLVQHPSQKILIIGHADLCGTSEENQKIAQNRAEKARDYMISQGVSKKQIKVKSKGSDQPVTLTDNPQAQALNRRIEILYFQK